MSDAIINKKGLSMKKKVSTVLTLFTVLNVFGKEIPDSLKQVNLNEIIVSATRVQGKMPITYSNIKASEIKKANTAKNIPHILETLPSVVAYSEDGSGVGNTSLRIRGTDATRINVTLNGMPLNNPESQEVYWVNIPDISNSLQSIQVQRGVGSSTNGSAAFGANISLKTIGSKQDAYGDASTGIGSYNTVSSTIATGTGILKNGLSLDARYSKVSGDGYIRNGKVDHKSAYAALSYYRDNQLIRLSYINGIQHTGITWEGISPKQMATNRRYNPAGEYIDDAGNVHYYGNETDNYYSNIAQLSYSNELSSKLSINIGLSYNHGYGYYENYRVDNKFSKFGLQPQVIGNLTHESSDLVRQKMMKNDFYVGNFTLNYNLDRFSLISGASITAFQGDHYGKLKWIKLNQNIPLDFEWYRNDSNKKDYNFFVKNTYSVDRNISLFTDLQYRYVNYNMDGIDDDLEKITSKNTFNFFNPKFGLSYQSEQHQLYGSLAVANREPLRTDLKESVKGGNVQKIKSERMFDYELGYKFGNTNTSFHANLYYMNYKNQMVQTGKLNDVGYKLMENVPNSYRAGIELSSAYKFTNWMQLDANITLSTNKIKEYTAYYDLYDSKWNYKGQVSEYLGKTDISFSPNIVASGVVTLTPIKHSTLSLFNKYVGKQYYDNTSNSENRLPDYFTLNLIAGYTFQTKSIGSIELQLFINNLLNKEYVANAWVATDRFVDGTQAVYTGLYPQATRNVMVKLGIRF
ncbi:MAG: hypothetical protein RL662_1517 [Bacteroidota bacterium]|jgi:iron complex outermembrane receptor protein